jgi:signal transduction histidine kinase
MKHANADAIWVTLCYPKIDQPFLQLTICDDGIGIAASDCTSDASFGLRNMRASAALLDGTLQIVPAEPHGTTITFCWRPRLS